MSTRKIAHIEIIDENEPLSLEKFLACAQMERAYLLEMVEAGIASPLGGTVEQWTFVRGDLRRIRIARRLMSDLEVNVSGAALILDLLAERDALRQRLRLLENILP